MTRIEDTLRQFGILAASDMPTEEQNIVAQLLPKRVHAVKGNYPIIQEMNFVEVLKAFYTDPITLVCLNPLGSENKRLLSIL